MVCDYFLVSILSEVFVGAMAAYGHFVTRPDPLYIRIYGVNCTGSEESLFDCPLHLTPYDVSYAHCAQNEAGVICRGIVQLVYNVVFRSNLTFLMTIFLKIGLQTPFSNCSNGELRLRGGSTPNQGRVEICINNAWGSVCHYGWGIADGNVACKQLGYQRFGRS